MRSSLTLDDNPFGSAPEGDGPGEPEPGLVWVFSGTRPAFGVLPLKKGALELGRGEIAGVVIDDKRMSRAHAHITFAAGAWLVRDLGSSNGTAADGQEVSGAAARPARRLLRAGASLFLLEADVRPFRSGIARSDESVMGPAMQLAFAAIARAARFGRVLHVTGESGTGKELSARAFHAAGPTGAGPFVALNAATLKPELAEAMLFGARKGAYTGAPGSVGYIESAGGGTLFLDEVAELDPAVQAKLLRTLETQEITPLGATRPAMVDFRFCSATHADMRSLVAAGKMREDLYFRIATPEVALPPLRSRLEEIPWLVSRSAQSVTGPAGPVGLHVSFVEACMQRVWPGNVRELLAEVKAAAQWAAEDGGVLFARHLHERAGTAGAAPVQALSANLPASAAGVSDEAIEEALRAAGNNRVKAAQALGIHRTQLYRRLKKRRGGSAGADGNE